MRDPDKRFRRIYLELTGACNLSCVFCPSGSFPAEEIPASVLETLVPALARFTGEIRPHLLGEPLLYPHMDQFLNLALDSGLTVKITTNGTLLDQAHRNCLLHPAVSEVNFSLQSFQPDDTPGAAMYLEKIVSFAESAPARDAGIYINYRFWNAHAGRLPLVQSRMLDHLLALYGCDASRFDFLKKTYRLSVKRRISFDEIFEWPSGSGDIVRDSGFCHGAVSHTAIRSNGDVVPCCLDYSGGIILGNIHRTPLEQIFSGERLESMRSGFVSGRRVEPFCMRCRFADRFDPALRNC